MVLKDQIFIFGMILLNKTSKALKALIKAFSAFLGKTVNSIITAKALNNGSVK